MFNYLKHKKYLALAGDFKEWTKFDECLYPSPAYLRDIVKYNSSHKARVKRAKKKKRDNLIQA